MIRKDNQSRFEKKHDFLMFFFLKKIIDFSPKLRLTVFNFQNLNHNSK